MCDTNKNVIKMGVIIKGVYYNAKMHETSWRKLHEGTYIGELSMEVSCLNLCFKFYFVMGTIFIQFKASWIIYH
jgi:hypothetical protein